jgi:hypothetical protein
MPRIVGDVAQAPGLHADIAREEHAAGVAVPAVENRGDVDVDDVAVLQPLLARDAVAHDVVDRGADRFREAAIVQRRGDRLVVEDELVAQAVEFARRDARLDMGRDEVERLRRQAAGLAHAFEALGAVKLDGPLVAPPIVDAVVLDLGGVAHYDYLACDIGRNKTMTVLGPRRPGPLMS